MGKKGAMKSPAPRRQTHDEAKRKYVRKEGRGRRSTGTAASAAATGEARAASDAAAATPTARPHTTASYPLEQHRNVSTILVIF